MRVFIAIPVSQDIKAKLIGIQQEFQRLSGEATWVREAGFHLTLKFFGDIDRRQIEPIVSCMGDTSSGYRSFSVAVSGVGVFPHPSRPRVLWVDIQDDGKQLIQLQQTLERSLKGRGFRTEDRHFAPHLTLARLRCIPRLGDFITCVTEHQTDTLGSLAVSHLELIESELNPTGARYSTIKAVRFQPMVLDHEADPK